MNINIRTGFYSFDTFNVSFESELLAFIRDEQKIVFLYNEIKNVSIKETGSSKVSLEITDDTRSLDATFADLEDAERFIRELQNKSSTQFELKINLRNERWA